MVTLEEYLRVNMKDFKRLGWTKGKLRQRLIYVFIDGWTTLVESGITEPIIDRKLKQVRLPKTS